MNASTSAPTAASIDDDRLVQARQRLDRLELYIRSDPANGALLIDAFETALSCHAWDRARFHLQHGQSLDTDPWGWRLREGDFWLAQGRYEKAVSVLEALRGASARPSGLDPVLLHNLAFIEFRQARYGECAARLASVMEDEHVAIPLLGIPSSPIDRALQVLWLRALHHDGQVERAMHWAVTAERHQFLDAYAAGIASLIALDASDLDAAQRWSAKASNGSEAGAPAIEALTTMASLALGQRDEQRARSLIDAALRLQPTDGRLWSLQGFTAMLGGDLGTAMTSFRHALEAMPMHVATWHGQGWAQVMCGDLPGARASFETALELDHELAESHAGLAVSLAMQGQPDAARQHADLALEREPGNLAGRYARSLLSGKRQDAEDVRSVAKHLLGGFARPSAGKND